MFTNHKNVYFNLFSDFKHILNITDLNYDKICELLRTLQQIFLKIRMLKTLLKKLLDHLLKQVK